MNARRPARRRSVRWSVDGPDSRSRPGARGGFTTLEILLAIGLIALFGTLLIGGSSRLLNDQPISADGVFWKACAAARKTALQSGHDVWLAFADDREHGKRFTVTDGAATQEFPVTAKSDVMVSFLSAQQIAGSAIILAGQVVETEALHFVTFYGDGTCTAFRLQIRVGVDAHVLSIDPWTCAPVLTAPEPR